MTRDPVELSVLTDARAHLIDAAVAKMPAEHKKFLISFERGEPDWSMFRVDSIDELPAVQWRIQNLAAIDPDRRRGLVNALEALLAG